MAKPNYSFEKRQREIAAKKQKDEKLAKKKEAREALTGRRRGGPELPSQLAIEYVDQKGADVSSAAKPYFARR